MPRPLQPRSPVFLGVVGFFGGFDFLKSQDAQSARALIIITNTHTHTHPPSLPSVPPSHSPSPKMRLPSVTTIACTSSCGQLYTIAAISPCCWGGGGAVESPRRGCRVEREVWLVGAQFLSVFVSAWGLETYFFSLGVAQTSPPQTERSHSPLSAAEKYMPRGRRKRWWWLTQTQPTCCLWFCWFGWLSWQRVDSP